MTNNDLDRLLENAVADAIGVPIATRGKRKARSAEAVRPAQSQPVRGELQNA